MPSAYQFNGIDEIGTYLTAEDLAHAEYIGDVTQSQMPHWVFYLGALSSFALLLLTVMKKRS
jgi:hypothetical protein